MSSGSSFPRAAAIVVSGWREYSRGSGSRHQNLQDFSKKQSGSKDRRHSTAPETAGYSRLWNITLGVTKILIEDEGLPMWSCRRCGDMVRCIHNPVTADATPRLPGKEAVKEKKTRGLAARPAMAVHRITDCNLRDLPSAFDTPFRSSIRKGLFFTHEICCHALPPTFSIFY